MQTVASNFAQHTREAFLAAHSPDHMLHKFAMTGIGALAKLPPSCTPAVLAGSRYRLPAPHFRRSLTGGEIREAARNAKAHLLRGTAVADASSVDKQSALAQSNFMDLSVDDRVVVKSLLCFLPIAHTMSCLINSWAHALMVIFT